MKMPKEIRDKGLNNKATEGVDGGLFGLGRNREPWIICAALFLLIVTVCLNMNFDTTERAFPAVNMLSQSSLKLPSYRSSEENPHDPGVTTSSENNSPHHDPVSNSLHHGPVINSYHDPVSNSLHHEPVINSHHQHPPFQNWHNLLVEESSNYTSTLLTLLQLNATSESPCFRASTQSVKLEGLPERFAGKYLFATDVLHRLILVAYEESGQRRCAGGDYFEVDLHSNNFRSRPPTVDFGNGTYGIDLIVPSRFNGSFVLEISLLYGNFHGIEHQPDAWAQMRVMLTDELALTAAVWKDEEQKIVNTLPLRQCTPSDFWDRTSWQGRWTRNRFNETCQADIYEKRFRCLPENDAEQYQCEEPWCSGPVGKLESNGWVYSAHCSFRIFRPEDAWDCLDGRWFLVWGDSNLPDTLRNLLLFVLDWPLPKDDWMSHFILPRNYEQAFVNPRSHDQTFKVSQVWNAAIKEDDINEGLSTLIEHEEHQQRLLSYFNASRTRWPDTIVMNSGMHDGVHYWNTESYIEAVDWALDWWIKLYTGIPLERRPQLLWRTTIAPAGLVRHMPSNPNKNEIYNHIMMEKLVEKRDVLPVKFVDTFDLTFPFHYDNNYSDGGHYGRPPGLFESPWMGEPHWYFVDIMLAHIFLNALCPSK